MSGRLVVSVAWLSGLAAYGQLQNGSFESNGYAWVDSCMWAQYLPGGHVGGGSTQALLPLYIDSLCSPVTAGMIYQELPSVQNGDVVELQGWARGVANELTHQDQVACRGAFWQVIGGAYSGNIQTGFGAQLFDTAWVPFSGSCTYSLAPDEVAIMMIGGYGFFQTEGRIYLDELVLTVNGSTGITVMSSAAVLHYDALTGMVSVAAVSGVEGVLELWDNMGRRVALRTEVSGRGWQADVSRSSAGTYLVRFTNQKGSSVLRFVK
jgi:hypothetical protein